MIIDFDTLPTKEHVNFKDGDGSCFFHIYEDDSNKIFKITLRPHSSVGFHTHVGSQEIMYCLTDEVIVNDDGIKSILKPGQATYCKDGHSHELINNSDKEVSLICSVTTLVK